MKNQTAQSNNYKKQCPDCKGRGSRRYGRPGPFGEAEYITDTCDYCRGAGVITVRLDALSSERQTEKGELGAPWLA